MEFFNNGIFEVMKGITDVANKVDNLDQKTSQLQSELNNFKTETQQNFKKVDKRIDSTDLRLEIFQQSVESRFNTKGGFTAKNRVSGKDFPYSVKMARYILIEKKMFKKDFLFVGALPENMENEKLYAACLSHYINGGTKEDAKKYVLPSIAEDIYTALQSFKAVEKSFYTQLIAK